MNALRREGQGGPCLTDAARGAPPDALSAKLHDATMARLNASVDVDKKTVEDVAKTFLKEQGLA